MSNFRDKLPKYEGSGLPKLKLPKLERKRAKAPKPDAGAVRAQGSGSGAKLAGLRAKLPKLEGSGLPDLKMPKLERKGTKAAKAPKAPKAAKPEGGRAKLQLPKPKGGLPKLQTGLPKPPERVAVVLDQLRESRMLVPIALLLVAIVAAPILLSRSGTETPPVTIAGSEAAGAGESGGSEFDPVVLAATPGLRDYRERLDPFSSKNPFRQQLTKTPKSAEKSGDSGEGGGDAITDAIADGSITSGGSGDSGSGSGTEEPAPPPPADTGGGDDGGTGPVPSPTPGDGGNGSGNGNGGNGGGTGGDPKPDPEPTKATVRYGPAGNTQLLIDLKPVHAMAGPDDPLAKLRRVNESSVVFGISPEVVLDGQGSCLNEQTPCNLLRLKVGETAKLTYRPTGETYRLQLLRVK